MCDLQAVPGEKAGSILAVDMSMGSALNVASPAVGTLLLTSHRFAAVAAASGSVLALLLLLIHAGAVQGMAI
jgi:spore maturation protein SpmB